GGRAWGSRSPRRFSACETALGEFRPVPYPAGTRCPPSAAERLGRGAGPQETPVQDTFGRPVGTCAPTPSAPRKLLARHRATPRALVAILSAGLHHSACGSA